MTLPYGLHSDFFLHRSVRSDVTVRTISLDDQAHWMRLWGLYLEFYETVLPPEQYELNWQRLFDPAEPVFGFLSEVNGEPCGVVHIIFHRSFWLEGPSCYLQDLYADKAVRGKGIGRALIEHVYEVAAQAGSARVHWLTKHHNATARQLYDRIAEETGFIQYARKL